MSTRRTALAPSRGVLTPTRLCPPQAEEANPGLVHDLIDHILESEQSKGGEDSIEKLLRVADKDLDGKPSNQQRRGGGGGDLQGCEWLERVC